MLPAMPSRISRSLGSGFLIQQRLGRQQHAGRAITTLNGGIVDERLLQGMQMGGIAQTLDGENLLAFRLDGKVQAGVHGSAIDQHGASAALAGAAAFLGAGQPNALADDMQQQVFGIDFQRIRVGR